MSPTSKSTPKYPFYVVSHARSDTRFTDKALTKLGVPHYTVIEESDYPAYSEIVDPDWLLVVPKEYHDNYDTFDNLGQTKSQGPGPARNFCWDHSIKNGYERHWVFDDNVSWFFRLNNNTREYVNDGTIFRVMEDFCDRYTNVAISGPNYSMFVPETQKTKPFHLNTRIYSMLLIKNDIPYRWRGRYNEDTDLSLRALKDGWVTIQFDTFLGDKIGTQTVKGGNTKEFYSVEGTTPKTVMLKQMHPDLTDIVFKFGRVHHNVNYTPFKNNRLIRRPDVVIPEGVDNYGMKLKTVEVK